MNSNTYLSKWPNVCVRITKSIGLNCKIYWSKSAKPTRWVGISIFIEISGACLQHTKSGGWTFLSDTGVPGPIYGSECLSVTEWCLWNCETDATLSDEDTNMFVRFCLQQWQKITYRTETAFWAAFYFLKFHLLDRRLQIWDIWKQGLFLVMI